MYILQPKQETWLYRINPAVKFIVLVVLVGIAFFNWRIDTAFYQMILYLLIWLLFSGHPWKRVLLLTSSFIMVFVTSALTLMLFGRGETIWWQWSLIKISEESFYHGLLVGFKTLSIGALGLLFALTTQPILLFYAMMQQLRLPAKYAYSFIAVIRMFPLVWEDFQHRTNALKVRGTRYSKGFRGIYERLSVYAVPLMAQSIRRAQRVAVAMEAKRFQIATTRTYYYVTGLTLKDLLFTIIMSGLAGLCFIVSYYIPLLDR